ncbi:MULTISPECIES: hypothetical protein [Rhizobium]|uniref:hypothetical protein n=1 Tax=Rhizobium TaxID=379 RepID=UPI001A98BC2F|nr:MULTISPECIES: hypothetical protein [Rhizobium]MBX4917436.1 hypothetical protein [Rhizobium bangladeshense]MBX4921923.1 hypothetical protein [Rhizobium bangladeshense]MBX5139225.1 hypothetical protein [Rhizobium lentis]MBY3123134.1 hypothetical protein [Rhizobium laguerreae]QSY97601.1 hypothetical protein J2J97_25810 [Rhizobium bangladeshense]
MDAAEQLLIRRIWAAIDAKDWKTALSALEDGVSVTPERLALFELYAHTLLDELQDMEDGCVLLREFVRLAIEKDSKDWLLGAMYQLFESSRDYSRFPAGERSSMGKELSRHILTLCQRVDAHSRAEYYNAMANFFHEFGNNDLAVDLVQVAVTLVEGPSQEEVEQPLRTQLLKRLAEYKCHEAVRAALL